jgi:tRNA (guanine-N7-)-methyltransferase
VTEGGGTPPSRAEVHGRRHGRALSRTRRSALAELLPKRRLSLPVDGGQLDPRLSFPVTVSEVWLEIGFGAGEHLVGRALSRPDVGCIGCEPYIPGVAALLTRVNELGLKGVRVFPDDARLLLGRLRRDSIDRVFLLFSDPWPKRRHHRRRFVRADTVAELGRVLRPGGELLFATDDMDYARWTLALMTDSDAFEWRARRPDDWRAPPAGWVQTRYQTKALARGARCVYLRFRRRSTDREPSHERKVLVREARPAI